jgi:gas vesicle protein
MSENNSATTFLSGMILGAAVGAGVALLLAPRTGKDTRALLSDKARELKEKAQHAFEKSKQVVQEQAGQFQSAPRV